jgi:LmbE family N-acetylglucosaminyl deacetylase
VARPQPPVGGGAALVLAPHPDDECITGGLALRLQRQVGLRVVAVPVTLGSLQGRRAGRLAEARAACGFLGFELQLAAPGGLERIGAQTRTQDPPHWQAAVRALADVIAQVQPAIVFFPTPRTGTAPTSAPTCWPGTPWRHRTRPSPA